MCGLPPQAQVSVCNQSVCPKVENILKTGGIITHFQPIVSVNKFKIAGYEALSRGFCEICNKLMMPNVLFNDSMPKETLCELDNLCKNTALKKFGSISSVEDQLLFLNFDVSYLKQPDIFLELFDPYNVKPGQIVVEVIESKVEDIDLLVNFVKICRNHGFLIALDDVGSGYSNFDRISLLKPDIIKIDRSIIQDIDKDYFKQEVLKSLVSLSKRIGCVVLTEGIEREEEALTCIELGTEFIQGYYFLKPQDITEVNTAEVMDKIIFVANKFRARKLEKIKRIKAFHSGLNTFIRGITEELSVSSPANFENILRRWISENDAVEAIYLINDKGLQETETILNCKVGNQCKIPHVSSKGISHEYRENFYLLHYGLFERYTTDPYLSMNTGFLCKTTALHFVDSRGRNWVICLEILENLSHIKETV